ncbi:MAG TPA: hypothetical protein VFR58_06115 [Flavisolibacter sp.]|nr:hypothetical protein [Flavisolibacter sp.]
MNAAARIFRLYIGEPGRFMLPLSVFSGVSGNNPHAGNTASPRGSEQLVLGLINPMTGLLNFSTDQSFRLGSKKRLTGFSITSQLGEKLLNGQQALSGKAFSFLSTYSNAGLMFQTGAWEKDKEKNMGIFWLLFRYHALRTARPFEELSGYPPYRRYFTGLSMGMGIEINNVLNVKAYYYRYHRPGDPVFELPIFQFSFSYNLAGQK